MVRLVALFLDGREFYVAVEGTASTRRPIRAGVPQGSCWSPQLHAVYTDDIPTLEGHLREGERNVLLALFADDSAYISSSSSPVIAAQRMQRLLDLLPTWLDKWRMAVNVGKTVAVLFSRKVNMPPPLRFRDRTVAGRYVRNDVIARDLKIESIGVFVARLARRMYDRADNGPHPHLRGFAPLHARPPDSRPLPRELEGL